MHPRFDATPASVAAHPVRYRPLLVVMCACVVLVVGLVAAVNLAVADLSTSALRPGAGSLAWVVDGYVVVFGCLVIPAGAAGDRWGSARLVLIGLLTLAVGALASGLAPNVESLIAFRALTGVGAAAVLPNTLAVLLRATTPERRLATIATWASMTGIGGVAGNIVGGAVIAATSWRWLFAAAALVAGLLALLSIRLSPPSARFPRSLDPWGALTLVATSVVLLSAIIEGAQFGWTDPVVLGGFGIAATLGTAWVLIEVRLLDPMLDPRLFRIPALRNACLGMATMFFGMFGLFYANASFLQLGKGYGPLQAGLGIVPLSIPLMVGGRRAARLPQRLGVAMTLGLAFTLVGGGLMGLSSVGSETAYPIYGCWLVVVGLGVTMAMPTLSSTITSSLPQAQAGVGAGLQATTRELGSAIGVAVTGTLMTSRFAAGLPADIRAEHSPHTVAEALQAAPTRAPQVAAAFVSAVERSLFTGGLVVIGLGTLIVISTATRGLRERDSDPTTTPLE